MELVNEIYQNLNPVRNTESLREKNKISNGVNTDITEAIKTVVLLLSPFVPHICEEVWQRLGHKESILKTNWPKYDEKFLEEEFVTIVIQVNGKLRSKIDVTTDISEDKLKELVLADTKLEPWLKNKPIKKFILVPQKLVNIVI